MNQLPLPKAKRLTLCAAALLAAVAVQAQSQPRHDGHMPAPTAQPVPMAPAHHPVQLAPAPAVPQGHMHMPAPAQHAPAPMQKEHKKHHGKDHQPQHHGQAHAPAHGAQHAPAPGAKVQLTPYQQNALRRCGVFKTEADREACVGRMLDSQASGSVEGGGVLRSYTQKVLIPPK